MFPDHRLLIIDLRTPHIWFLPLILHRFLPTAHLNSIRGINKQCSHNVGAIRFVSCTKRANYSSKVKYILITDNTKFQIVVSTTLNDGRVTHIKLAGIHPCHILLVCYGWLHPFCKLCMLDFLWKKNINILLSQCQTIHPRNNFKKRLKSVVTLFLTPSDSGSTSPRTQKIQILSTSPACGHPTIEPSSKRYNITLVETGPPSQMGYDMPRMWNRFVSELVLQRVTT